MTLLKQLWSILRADDEQADLAEDFGEMFRLVQSMVLDSSRLYWSDRPSPDSIRPLYEQDIQVNQLQRRIRKRLVTRLAVGGAGEAPYGLLIMSLAKDVERLGDYAKNLAEVAVMEHEPFPDDPLRAELSSIRETVDKLVRDAHDAYMAGDVELSNELIEAGRAACRSCDRLIDAIAASGHPASVAVSMALGARFYKRIAAHLLNLLSAVVMPLEELDYFDPARLGQGSG